RRGQARIADHLEWLRDRLALRGEAHGVGAGSDARPACAARPEDQALEPATGGRAEPPHEAVQAGLGRQLLGPAPAGAVVIVAFGEGAALVVLLVARVGEAPHDLAGGVEHL